MSILLLVSWTLLLVVVTAFFHRFTLIRWYVFQQRWPLYFLWYLIICCYLCQNRVYSSLSVSGSAKVGPAGASGAHAPVIKTCAPAVGQVQLVWQSKLLSTRDGYIWQLKLVTGLKVLIGVYCYAECCLCSFLDCLVSTCANIQFCCLFSLRVLSRPPISVLVINYWPNSVCPVINYSALAVKFFWRCHCVCAFLYHLLARYCTCVACWSLC